MFNVLAIFHSILTCSVGKKPSAKHTISAEGFGRGFWKMGRPKLNDSPHFRGEGGQRPFNIDENSRVSSLSMYSPRAMRWAENTCRAAMCPRLPVLTVLPYLLRSPPCEPRLTSLRCGLLSKPRSDLALVPLFNQ